MSEIFELAINKAKEGQKENFLNTRASFVEVLGKEPNTLNEGKWQPFFTLGEINLEEVLIGMTHWNSMQGFGQTAAKLLPQAEARNYFASFDPLAYVLLQTADGKPFDMESIKKEGTVVEFAIRRGKTPEAFGAARETFFKSLENYEGYLFAREFQVYQLDQNSMPQFQQGVQAVIIVWENATAFQKAANPIFGTPEYQNFAQNLEVSAYFASSPLK
ncbi:hypothetical protein [Hugenholtzia roseola]|uniref:hypothetical protein n=1 Tax=Hugenholtzia roseola TaxID=1002 RepID=UPI00040B8887|nr:hypothetical protein [Hugenholtzia roseola]